MTGMQACAGGLFRARAATIGVAGLALLLSSASPLPAAPFRDVLGQPSTMVAHAERSVLLAASRAGDRLVAVGERGRIVFSDDNGVSWRQARVPVSVTLTAVTFPTPLTGWAVGHAGVILKSGDGGASWQLRMDGRQAASLGLRAAEEMSAADPAREAAIATARRLVEEGDDKPFLDVSFRDERHGVAVGAYGLAVHTEDGGQSWASWTPVMGNPDGRHFYAVRWEKDRLYAAGEQGLFVRSLDGGRSFQRIATPYEGSYFGLVLLPQGRLILAGLKGNAFRSDDGGDSFQPVAVPQPISFNGGLVMANGAALFVNQAGRLLITRAGDTSMETILDPPGPPAVAVVPTEDDRLVGVGFGGATRYPPLVLAGTK